jgi:hypothetical protein
MLLDFTRTFFASYDERRSFMGQQLPGHEIFLENKAAAISTNACWLPASRVVLHNLASN